MFRALISSLRRPVCLIRTVSTVPSARFGHCSGNICESVRPFLVDRCFGHFWHPEHKYKLFFTLTGLGVVVWSLRPGQARCEEDTAEIRLVTYNVLSPLLGRASQFPLSKPEDIKPENRFAKVLVQIERSVIDSQVIALQEVDLGWAGKLHAYFAERDYCVVFAQYGSSFSGYMGVMMAWPRRAYEALDVDISRISDTAPKKIWPPQAKENNTYGTFTSRELKSILGTFPPDLTSFSEWDAARERKNEAVFVRLRPRRPGSKSFVVSTYHMPCLFGSPEKVRVMNIHVRLLLEKLHAFAAGDPAVLMGDFNIKPMDAAYSLITCGGELSKATPIAPEEFTGLHERFPSDAAVPGGLASAYQTFHGREPLFTNFTFNPGQSEQFCETLDYIWFTPGSLSVIACPALPQSREESDGPFPSPREPSDHLPLYATLRLSAAR